MQDGSLLYIIEFTSLVAAGECLSLSMTNTPVDAELATVGSSNNICFTLEPNNLLFNTPLCNFFNPNDMDFYGFTNSIYCDDMNPNINPDATELCDGIDNNCNREIDEDVFLFSYYADADGDGFGDPNTETLSCEIIPGFEENMDDCDDTNENVNPDAQKCNDGLDNNCDGEVEEIDISSFYYPDQDGDGYGAMVYATISCLDPVGFVQNNIDCDYSNPMINPDASEECDGIDNNCDGIVHEGFV